MPADRPTPTGRAAEAWARLALSWPERRQLLPILRQAIELIPEDDATRTRGRLLAAVVALDVDIETIIHLGCPVPGGFDAMANPDEVMRRARDGR